MNFSCLSSVFMCFAQNLVILEHCQHKMSMHWSETPLKRRGHQSSGARAPEFWCPFKLSNSFFCFNLKTGHQKYELSCLPSVFMCFIRNLVILEHCQHEMSMHWWENTPNQVGGTRVLVPGHQKSGAWAPEVWCPFKLTNRFFVLISRMGFRTLNLCCFPSVFMCSTQNLVLSEHGQHEWACIDEKTRKN